MKKTIFVLAFLGCLLWTIKIVQVNKADTSIVKYLEINETFVKDELEVTPLMGGVYTVEEYKALTGNEDMDLSFAESNGEMIICVLLHIKNISDSALRWEYVINKLDYGFESDRWMSNAISSYTNGLRIVHTEKMESGSEVDFWYATGINSLPFDSDHWVNIQNIQFYYVVDVYPNSTRVRIPLESEGTV